MNVKIHFFTYIKYGKVKYKESVIMNFMQQIETRMQLKNKKNAKNLINIKLSLVLVI